MKRYESLPIVVLFFFLVIPLSYAYPEYPLENPLAATHYYPLADYTDAIGAIDITNINTDLVDDDFGSDKHAYFNAANDALDMNNQAFQLNGAWTICMWLRMNASLGNYMSPFGAVGSTQSIFYRAAEVYPIGYQVAKVPSFSSKTTSNTYLSGKPIWQHLCFTSDGTGGAGALHVYVNGSESLIAHAAGTDDTIVNESVGYDMYIGSYNNQGTATGAFNGGEIDEILIWNDRSILESEALTIFDGNFTSTATPQVELRISNTTYANNKTIYHISEEFYVYANLTYSNGTIIDNSSETCNFTGEKGWQSYDSATTEPFTLCGTGCTYSKYTESFTSLSAGSIQNMLHFDACENNIEHGDVITHINCTNGGYTEIIPSEAFPSCSVADATIYVNTSICAANTTVNITIAFNGVNVQRKTIDNIDLDIQFAKQTITDVIYIDTLFGVAGDFEYYDAGTYLIHTNCSLGVGDTEQISVLANNPIIYISKMNNSVDEYSLSSGMVIEYKTGTWELYYDVIEPSLDNVMITLYNNSGVVKQITSLGNFQFNSTSVVDFANPYNITIFANNTGGGSSTSYVVFNITDTATPQATGFDDAEVSTNGTYTWNAMITDEYLWNFSISCTNGFNRSVNSIGNQSMTFTDSMTVSKATNCTVIVKDGHTSLDYPFAEVPIIKDVADKELIFADTVMTFDKDLKKIETSVKPDRISFCIETLNKEETVRHPIPDGCVIAPSSPFRGHYICGNYAVDFENEEGAIVSIVNNTVIIDYSTQKDNKVCFNSIVALNTLTLIQQFTIAATPTVYDNTIVDSTNWFNTDALDTQTTAGALMYFFLLFIVIGLIVFTERIQIPAMGFLTALMIWFYGWLIYTKIAAIIGIFIYLASFMYMMRSIVMVNS